MIRHLIAKEPSTLRLDRNECICPSVLRKAINLCKIDPIDFCSYNTAYDVLSTISDQIQVTSNKIHINNGSECVIGKLVHLLDCDTWITTDPTFELFNFYCSLFFKKVTTTPFTLKDNKFNINIPTVGTTNTGLYIVSPHNPTGYIFSYTDIINYSNKYKYVIVDQAYLSPIAPYINFPENVIIVRTFSKMGGITGMRLGFSISNPFIADSLNQHRPMYLNTITLKIANTLLQNNLLNDIEEEFKLTSSILKNEFKDNFLLCAGNFILLRNIRSYKEKNLKKYSISNTEFFRMTLFDSETLNNF